MAKGGYRPTAGRKPDPNSARQKRLAAKAEKAASGDRGLTAADGMKKPEAGEDWPFGKTETPPAGEPQLSFKTPIEFWQHVLQDPGSSMSAKANAAYSLAPYVHPKVAPTAKKEETKGKAKEASKGRFGARPAPLKLVAGG
jgi:phage terminase small subunit